VHKELHNLYPSSNSSFHEIGPITHFSLAIRGINTRELDGTEFIKKWILIGKPEGKR
jgi:hypothetical protein